MRKYKIILIEDNQHELELILNSIRQIVGEECIHFQNAEAAINYMSMIPRYAIPDLILTDLKMPGAGGFYIIQKVRSFALLKGVPVVIFTTSDEEQDISNAYNLGVNAFVLKPLSSKRFSESVQAILKFWLRYNVTNKQLYI